uniref:MSP domain-containing protein n=1 Tax=Panagrellus redivivus TaxID=6233 RepID=A0A7E4UWC6_PANRE
MTRRHRRRRSERSPSIPASESPRTDYSVRLDASRQDSPMPILPMLGASRLTCFDATSPQSHSEFVIPGQVVIQNADKVQGCVLQLRVVVADKKDAAGKPLFFDVKVNCPNFEPTTAYVNGKPAKMSIQ